MSLADIHWTFDVGVTSILAMPTGWRVEIQVREATVGGAYVETGAAGRYVVEVRRERGALRAEVALGAKSGLGRWLATRTATMAAEADELAAIVEAVPASRPPAPVPPRPPASGEALARAMMDRGAEDPQVERERARILAQARARAER